MTDETRDQLETIEGHLKAAIDGLRGLAPVVVANESTAALLNRLIADELLDTSEVAAVLGIATSSVGTYKIRHADFPTPAVVKNNGNCPLWLRMDVVAWRTAHPGRKP